MKPAPNYDFSIDRNLLDQQYCIDEAELIKRLNRVVSAVPDDLEAHLAFVVMESRGEVLPYFFAEPKTAEGFILRSKEIVDAYAMFTSKTTRDMFKNMLTKLLEYEGYRKRTFDAFNSGIRPYSLSERVDLVDLLYDGNNEQTIAELRIIEADSVTNGRSAADTITLGSIHIIGKQTDATNYFKAEKGDEGALKRNAQGKYVSFQQTVKEKVFKALLDYEGYFEDRYAELNRILSQGAVDINVQRRIRRK